MTMLGSDRYASTQPCAVCGSMTTSSLSDFCSTHRDWSECTECHEYVEETCASTNGGNLCEGCYIARSCDICGRESDEIRTGVEDRMCPSCYVHRDEETV